MIDNMKFNSFFKLHSANVDNANQQGFWMLTDEIIKTYILEICEKKDNVVVADFGGGTGRWVKIIDSYFNESKFIIIDLSKDMLSRSQEKIQSNVYTNEVSLVHSNIESIPNIKDGSIDYIISTYNPLSFVDKPQRVIDEAFRILKPGGKAMFTIQAYYSALSSKINNYLAASDELEYIAQNKKLKWNDFVPETWQLSQDDMEKMFQKSGFSNIESRGIATLTQPQSEDWDQTNIKIGELSQKLNSDQNFFDAILKLELATGKDQRAINRAMNIMTFGQK